MGQTTGFRKSLTPAAAKHQISHSSLPQSAARQVDYRFRLRQICEHSLLYFPSPDLEHFQNELEVYLEDEIYADVVARNVAPFPVRFDFSDDAEKFVDVHHRYSHLTLGQYENCRIPVSSPLGPLAFGVGLKQHRIVTRYIEYARASCLE